MEIKNCMFCGKPPNISPVVDFEKNELIGYRAACLECMRVAERGKDKQAAIKNWNKEIEWFLNGPQ